MSRTRPVGPQYRSPSGRYWEWPAIIREAKRHPDTWWLLASSVTRYAVRLINEQRNPALKTTGGRLRARGMNPHTVDGQHRIDLLITWQPERDTR